MSMKPDVADFIMKMVLGSHGVVGSAVTFLTAKVSLIMGYQSFWSRGGWMMLLFDLSLLPESMFRLLSSGKLGWV